MFLLNIISAVSWQRVREQAHSLLPYHASLESDTEKKSLPLKCTIKRNQEGNEIMGASIRMKSIKSRLICFLEEKQQFIDFPKRNIRAWVGEFGNIVLRPILKEKPYMPYLEKGYRKLAQLHMSSYMETFNKMLET